MSVFAKKYFLNFSRALIERGDQDRAVQVDLFDNGSGADLITNDGLYSRYFTKYDGYNGRYTLRCQVRGDEETDFITEREEVFQTQISDLVEFRWQRSLGNLKTYPQRPGSHTPVCCGSSTGNNYVTEKTGEFLRQTNGGSFKVENAPTEDADIFAPERVKDLRATFKDDGIEVMFTATGDDLDEGTGWRL